MPSTDQQVAAAVAGRYEVDREIGRGGMATVYLARDVKHQRKVALKVLNPELGAILGVERFLSEIQVTANLQHPHLLPLYDSGESNGLLYYVMPYVEGEGLRDLMNRQKQLPVDDAVRLAAAVASALDYAHQHGVIHRDLKPENILLQQGQPFVADFGIALAVTNAGGNRITQTGLSLGTPQYMSPEQATGERAVDARTDIYSLGCVLYEMLAGEPPYMGGTTQAVIAKILTEKPRDVRELRDRVPEHVAWAIDRALAKIPADRFATAGELHDVLVGRTRMARPGNAQRPTPTAQRLTRALPWVLLAAAVGWGVIETRGSRSAPTSNARFVVSLPGASLIDGFALSPDAKSLAYIAGVGAAKQLNVRSLDQLDARSLPGTTGADHPVWSPSASWIAFTANGQVQKASAAGGAAQVVSPMGFGYDWIDDETMVIGSGLAGSGLRLSTRAGTPPTTVTKPDVNAGEMFHVWPLVLPKKKVAFVVWGAGGLEDDYLAIGDLGTGRYVESKLVAVTTVAYQDGWLLYQDVDRRLMAVRVDLGALRFEGSPVTVQENVVGATIKPSAALVLSGVRTTGIYRIPSGTATVGPLVLESDGVITGVRVSPERMRIAYVVTRGDSAQLFVHDLRAHTSVRLWTGGGVKDPAWMPDGRSIVYSEGAPRVGLWRISADGGEPTLLVSRNFPRHLDISPDGRTLVFTVNVPFGNAERRYDLWAAPLADTSAAHVIVSDRDGKSLPAVSPNGRWLAFESNDNARDEVYVRSFTGAPGQWRISVAGGMEPRWSRDSRTLYYRQSGDVIKATVRESASGIEVTSRELVAHFASSSLSEWDPMYDVVGDGELLVASANERGWQLVFAQNWLEEFRRRVSRSP